MTGDTPGLSDLPATDRAHLIHPFLPAAVDSRVVMTEGQGCRLRDASGRTYLDATAGMWLCQVGHGRPELAQAAHDQMARLEYSTNFWDFGCDRTIELAARLAGLAPPGIDHAFFTTGGSEGIEAALRMARYVHHRRGEPDRTWFLSRQSAYHGAGYGSGSVSGFAAFAEGFGPMLPHVHHLTAPYPYRSGLDAPSALTDACVRELEAAIDRIGAHRIAAMVGEPVMALAGMVAPPEDYWPRVTEVLHRHGILLILDEVVTAFGRLGEWFAGTRLGAQADIIVTSKGLTSGYFPLGAVLTSGAIAEVLSEGTGFPVGHTYNGHPVGCAVALSNLDIIDGEKLLEAADDVGGHLADALRPLEELDVVGEVRRTGLMLGIELVADKTDRRPLPHGAYAVADAVRDRTGVLVRGGPYALTLAPPLVMTHQEADEAADALHTVLARLTPDGEPH
ncbi:aspartate aminotransferase family protein [Streptomyces sp. CA-132043]|uniref:aminotransferase family protein n=1 Tax=Streptomyces sp. CA-132043 TaxID=3240048 RepID=UPI003D8F17E0